MNLQKGAVKDYMKQQKREVWWSWMSTKKAELSEQVQSNNVWYTKSEAEIDRKDHDAKGPLVKITLEQVNE